MANSTKKVANFSKNDQFKITNFIRLNGITVFYGLFDKYLAIVMYTGAPYA